MLKRVFEGVEKSPLVCLEGTVMVCNWSVFAFLRNS